MPSLSSPFFFCNNADKKRYAPQSSAVRKVKSDTENYKDNKQVLLLPLLPSSSSPFLPLPRLPPLPSSHIISSSSSSSTSSSRKHRQPRFVRAIERDNKTVKLSGFAEQDAVKVSNPSRPPLRARHPRPIRATATPVQRARRHGGAIVPRPADRRPPRRRNRPQELQILIPHLPVQSADLLHRNARLTELHSTKNETNNPIVSLSQHFSQRATKGRSAKIEQQGQGRVGRKQERVCLSALASSVIVRNDGRG